MCGIEAVCTSDASAEAVLTLPAGHTLYGDHVIARFLGRTQAKGLYGDLESDPMLAAEVDQYSQHRGFALRLGVLRIFVWC
jgi:hypothetical protein